MKHFEISVLRRIRFAELRKIPMEQLNFTCKLTPLVRNKCWKYMLKILWKRGEIALEEQFFLLSTISCYLMLDFCIKTRIRFYLRDKTVIRDNRSRDNEDRLYLHSQLSISRTLISQIPSDKIFPIFQFFQFSFNFQLRIFQTSDNPK